MPKISFNLLLLSLIATSVGTGILIRYIQNSTTQLELTSSQSKNSDVSNQQDITQKISALDNPITVSVNSKKSISRPKAESWNTSKKY